MGASMLVYWSLFVFFAAGTLLEAGKKPDFHKQRPAWVLGGLLILLMVGLRFEVGADWQQYEFIFAYAQRADLEKVLSIGDPGFQLLNWTIGQIGAEFLWVNLFCAAIFTVGLFRFARLQPDPWLAVLIAVPYLVIVIAQGYTRQAAALGIIMLGLSSLIRGGSLARFVLFIALAATFHKTAIVVLPLAIFSRPTNRLFNLIGGVAALYGLFDFFLAGSMEMFVENYIGREYSSQGAAIRIAMAVLAAGLFLARRKDFGFPAGEDRMWYYFALASLAALAALLLTPSSTAVDRLSLYLMPLQLVILGRVPFVYMNRTLATALVGAYCFAVQFVWLNFATHAKYWLPYQVYPLFS